ncbi:MAG: polysaccharide biosynthesis C-terminal domain-containing protein, partial [Ferruginibacter sp.]
INYFFIPRYGYIACAWATFFCYGSMMLMSYVWGQKVYRIPYAWKKLVAYMTIAVLLFFIHKGVVTLTDNLVIQSATGAILLALYMLFISRIEKHEFAKLPLIGKYFNR